MTDEPERIALRWEPGKAVTSGPLMQSKDYTHYIRADHAEALVRAAYEAAARRHDELWRETSGYKSAQIRALTIADAQKVMGEGE